MDNAHKNAELSKSILLSDRHDRQWNQFKGVEQNIRVKFRNE